MARPIKVRKVCCLPETDLFGPMNKAKSAQEKIIMTVEEFETIRLIDKEGMMQEECAAIMNVARTTVQRIYVMARKKIATALVEGKVLKITGGVYQLCEEDEKEAFKCRMKRCRKQKVR